MGKAYRMRCSFSNLHRQCAERRTGLLTSFSLGYCASRAIRQSARKGLKHTTAMMACASTNAACNTEMGSCTPCKCLAPSCCRHNWNWGMGVHRGLRSDDALGP
eukprot:816202-Pelagomonas_calceolata.AAC.4